MGWGERQVKFGTRRPKVVIGYPTGASVTLPFHASMLALVAYELPKGEGRLLGKVTHTQGLYVADNRQLLIQRMLESDADWLLQIDTDIEFPKTLLETLVLAAGSDKLILAASVPLGNAPTVGYIRALDKPGLWNPVIDPPREGEFVECDGVATAVLLTHRRVFEDIAARHGQCWMHHIYVPARPQDTLSPREFKFISQGEDLAFSLRAREAGHRIWMMYVRGLKHHKGQALTHDRLAPAAEADLRADTGVGELVQDDEVAV